MLRNERGQAFQLMVALVLVMIFISVYVWWETRPQEKISITDTSFERKELVPGQSTTLTVKIKNMSDKVIASNVSVAITPLDPSVVRVVGENQAVFEIVGPGEDKLPTFTISIVQGSTKGKYSITVITSVDSPFQGDREVTAITVI